jgi:anthranilate synthase component 1
VTDSITETSFEQFQLLAKSGTLVPVCREVIADTLTPVSAFLRVAADSERSFLFESVVGGERLARYSFLGKDPLLTLRSLRGETVREEAGQSEVVDSPFVDAVRELMARYCSPIIPGLPRFTGGAVGYLSYDAARWFEPTLEKAREAYAKADDENDTAAFMLFDTVLAFDHVKGRILLIANVTLTEFDDTQLRASYQRAQSKLETLQAELSKELPEMASEAASQLTITSNTTQEEFENAVRIAKDYIAAGDIFQVVLSQRFSVEISADPFTVYRALRYVNPSPYMYFIRMAGLSIVGASPEMLVRAEEQGVETHPIAGTRPRGITDKDDERLAKELLANQKERAEHVMLVDLGRNDLGRVCRFGSVDIPQFMELEKYSHVMHLVSRVTGTLDDKYDCVDALAACFPAGTVSGAPKIRAMEIIDELEPTTRGVYAGSVGYFDFAGNLDCCITIRTIVIRDGRAYVQAGAGIVADSDPAAEYEETKAKASALITALELAERGLELSGLAGKPKR